jgi:hypothetical protein
MKVIPLFNLLVYGNVELRKKAYLMVATLAAQAPKRPSSNFQKTKVMLIQLRIYIRGLPIITNPFLCRFTKRPSPNKKSLSSCVSCVPSTWPAWQYRFFNGFLNQGIGKNWFCILVLHRLFACRTSF